ncbi:MAG: MFS transporter [Cyclobacteriaceae bacterium]|nr:MFS transporter [Cyclobacteriaceae bacterium]
MTTLSPAINNPRIINAWCVYDWANSVYSLVITSAIFPVYYQAVTTGADGSDQVSFFGFTLANSVLYSYALSFAFLVVAPLLPLLSGIADYAGRKKTFMKLFVYIGGLGCMGLYFFEGPNIEWGILCSVLASLGYAGSVVFYDAFLPEIASEDRMDAVSARGYSMGYYGGVVLLIINLVMIMNWNTFGFSSEGMATRFAFLMVGLWWIGFAQYTFAVLPETRRASSGKRLLFHGYHELIKVWKSFASHKDIGRYLGAYFFFNMGVQTVMYMAATFGSKELKLEDGKLIVTVLLIQLVGAIGAHLFARISRARGNKATLVIMIISWIGICLLAYWVTTEYEFYVIAVLVGTVMGGIQSLSRATYAKLIPASSIDNASYFSFFDVTFNLSIVCGTFSYGLIEHLTGSMRNSTLALAVFFIIGLILLRRVESKSLSPR